MPNLKIFVDEVIYPDCRDQLSRALGPIRDMLCVELQVDPSAFQFAVLSVGAMPDLPRVNVEMQVLPNPERSREHMLAVGARLRQMVEAATSARVAVRVSALDPQTYIALK